MTTATLARSFFFGGDDRLGGPPTAIKNDNRSLLDFGFETVETETLSVRPLQC